MTVWEYLIVSLPEFGEATTGTLRPRWPESERYVAAAPASEANPVNASAVVRSSDDGCSSANRSVLRTGDKPTYVRSSQGHDPYRAPHQPALLRLCSQSSSVQSVGHETGRDPVLDRVPTHGGNEGVIVRACRDAITATDGWRLEKGKRSICCRRERRVALLNRERRNAESGSHWNRRSSPEYGSAWLIVSYVHATPRPSPVLAEGEGARGPTAPDVRWLQQTRRSRPR
jgi:hypothetical protein